MSEYSDRDAVIVGAVRTPVGKGKANGALHDVLPVDLLAHSLREIVERTGVDPAQVDDVIAGAVTQVGDQSVNIARNALLGAGFPESVPGTTVDRQCGSSQQAISFAAQGVLAGVLRHRDRRGRRVDVAGAHGQLGAARQRPVRRRAWPSGTPEGLVPQGISAELIAAKWGLSRTELDEFSASSHEKAARATKDGLFDNELAPIAGLSTDEIIRPGTTVETLAGLRPAFFNEAYSAALPTDQLGDHAGQLVAAVRRQRRGDDHQRGRRPQARPAAAGPHPHHDGGRLRPAVHADRRHSGDREGAGPRGSDAGRHRPVRGQRGLRAGGAGLGQGRWRGARTPILAKTNVNGGAIAIGHPLGASGARIMTTMVNALEQRDGRYALQTMCEGGGMANATIIERL